MTDEDGAPRGAVRRSGTGPGPAGALVDRYAGVLLDVDGVVRLGSAPIPGAGETVTELRRRGVGVVFVTNNAAHTPAEMAAALRAVDVPAEPGDVMTSALAAAAQLEPGTHCLVIGMTGLRQALTERGCPLVDEPDAAEAVVVGLDTGVTYGDLRRAAAAIRAGARFLATNVDPTFPTAEGLLPGNGAVVAALATTTSVRPEVAGKPHAPLLRAAAALLPDGPVLMVGDRHDTDIAGAAALGWDTALVLSGVTGPGDVEGLSPPPTWVLDSVTGVLAPEPAAVPAATGASKPFLRSATAADTEAVLALWDGAGMLAYTREPQRDIAAILAHDPSLFLVAEREGEVVGVLLGTVDGRRGWIMRVAVDARLRGGGVGRALTEEVERRMAARGIPQANVLVVSDNVGAQAFWERLGYGAAMPVTLRTKRLDAAPADGC